MPLHLLDYFMHGEISLYACLFDYKRQNKQKYLLEIYLLILICVYPIDACILNNTDIYDKNE